MSPSVGQVSATAEEHTDAEKNSHWFRRTVCKIHRGRARSPCIIPLESIFRSGRRSSDGLKVAIISAIRVRVFPDAPDERYHSAYVPRNFCAAAGAVSACVCVRDTRGLPSTECREKMHRERPPVWNSSGNGGAS